MQRVYLIPVIGILTLAAVLFAFSPRETFNPDDQPAPIVAR
jgi:hypothetical protein